MLEKDQFDLPSRLKVFAYVTEQKAPIYRAIMRVFMESKEQFALHLRPYDVLETVRRMHPQLEMDESGVDSGLAQLCEWGNLEAHPDTGDVLTVEDFYKQRYLFQITAPGEAAERAIESYEEAAERKGELQTSALVDIRALLKELRELAAETQPDSGKIHRNLVTLRTRFEELTSRAQAFMSSLQRKIDLQAAGLDQFISYKQRLIDYLERFIGELAIATDEIAETVRDIEAATPSGLDKLLQAAAERDVMDAVDATSEDLSQELGQWHARWDGLRSWFISRPGSPCNASVLRARARASIPALLSVITSINDRRITRIDRSNDLRVLARWFAETDSEADAHRLWRTTFALSQVRHLVVDDATLDEHEAQNITADISWLDAPPLHISLRLREYGAYSRAGRLSSVVDRSADKAKLAAAAQEEAQLLLMAQRRLATGKRFRLSELAELETNEFDLLLDMLGEAVSARVLPSDVSEVVSSDGSLRITLERTCDERTAVIQTLDGIFSGPDHWITVAPSSEEAAP